MHKEEYCAEGGGSNPAQFPELMPFPAEAAASKTHSRP